MLSFEELTIQSFEVEQSTEQLSEVRVNMSEENFDLAIGFLSNTAPISLITAEPDLIKVEVIQRSDENYSGVVKDVNIELEPCNENSYFAKLDENKQQLLKYGLCTQDKESMILQGGTTSAK